MYIECSPVGQLVSRAEERAGRQSQDYVCGHRMHQLVQERPAGTSPSALGYIHLVLKNSAVPIPLSFPQKSIPIICSTIHRDQFRPLALSSPPHVHPSDRP